MKYKHTTLVRNNHKLGLSRLIVKDEAGSVDLELPSYSAAKFLQEYLESNIGIASTVRNQYHSIKPLPQWTGNGLNALRKSLGLDLEAFRWLLDVSVTTLCAYEKNDALPSLVSVALEYLVSRNLVSNQLSQRSYNRLIDKLEQLHLTGEQIRSVRLSQGVTQETFGIKMHWSRKQVSYIENRSPSLLQSLYIRYFYEPLFQRLKMV